MWVQIEAVSGYDRLVEGIPPPPPPWGLRPPAEGPWGRGEGKGGVCINCGGDKNGSEDIKILDKANKY